MYYKVDTGKITCLLGRIALVIVSGIKVKICVSHLKYNS